MALKFSKLKRSRLKEFYTEILFEKICTPAFYKRGWFRLNDVLQGCRLIENNCFEYRQFFQWIKKNLSVDAVKYLKLFFSCISIDNYHSLQMAILFYNIAIKHNNYNNNKKRLKFLRSGKVFTQ